MCTILKPYESETSMYKGKSINSIYALVNVNPYNPPPPGHMLGLATYLPFYW